MGQPTIFSIQSGGLSARGKLVGSSGGVACQPRHAVEVGVMAGEMDQGLIRADKGTGAEWGKGTGYFSKRKSTIFPTAVLCLPLGLGLSRLPIPVSGDQPLGRRHELLVLNVPDRRSFLAPGGGC